MSESNRRRVLRHIKSKLYSRNGLRCLNGRQIWTHEDGSCGTDLRTTPAIRLWVGMCFRWGNLSDYGLTWCGDAHIKMRLLCLLVLVIIERGLRWRSSVGRAAVL